MKVLSMLIHAPFAVRGFAYLLYVCCEGPTLNQLKVLNMLIQAPLPVTGVFFFCFVTCLCSFRVKLNGIEMSEIILIST